MRETIQKMKEESGHLGWMKSVKLFLDSQAWVTRADHLHRRKREEESNCRKNNIVM